MQTITDKGRIAEILRGFVRELSKQRAKILYEIRVKPGAIWNGWTVTPGGLIIAGARPDSIVHHCDTGHTVFNLTNSDSDYTRTIGQVRLADIESITLLR